MSTVLESPVVHASATVSERLRDTTAAVRLSFTWPGVRKALSAEQKSRAAEAFDADGSSIAATKRLIDTSHPAFKAVTAVKSQATGYWKGMTLPFISYGGSSLLALAVGMGMVLALTRRRAPGRVRMAVAWQGKNSFVNHGQNSPV